MKGTRFEILYDPADPSDARIADNRTWLIIGIFIGAGGLIFLAGVFLPRVFKETDGTMS